MASSVVIAVTFGADENRRSSSPQSVEISSGARIGSDGSRRMLNAG
jgi:hypothetical protein